MRQWTIPLLTETSLKNGKPGKSSKNEIISETSTWPTANVEQKLREAAVGGRMATANVSLCFWSNISSRRAGCAYTITTDKRERRRTRQQMHLVVREWKPQNPKICGIKNSRVLSFPNGAEISNCENACLKTQMRLAAFKNHNQVLESGGAEN